MSVFTPRDLTDVPVDRTGEVVTCQGERFRRYLEADTIADRVAELGAAIEQDYAGRVPVFVSVLNGAFVFTADLMRRVEGPCEVDFVGLSSYGNAMSSSGKVRELKSVNADLEGRDVIVVEDIVDTGLSMDFLIDRLAEYDPASLRVATLLHKPAAAQVEVPLDYVGFEIPDLFVIGYGLDYAQRARNLPDIYIRDEEG
jgi:hypoxanthine phosphoribosyltransferase